ncbi:HAD-IIB family hydrolase [Paenibacillus chungangensis]|uniref:HAD-IIB family hydrolase n=1 Tax=Paenibacillus chungangensis TaxID=696535 RepID=A0ABW3HT86_9BACL
MQFVFDLDGTICFRGKPISDGIVGALERLSAAGHAVIFASARPIRDMLPVLPERFHSYTMIGGNGSLAARNGHILVFGSFSEEQSAKLRQLLQQYDAAYLADGHWDYSYTGIMDHPIRNNLDPAGLAKQVDIDVHEAIVKLLILSATDMEEVAARLEELDLVLHRHDKENVIDISPSGIHKWSALQRLNVRRGEYIAFGNDANDVTMFMNAARSVMIGYHAELAKHATDFIPHDGNSEETEARIEEKLRELGSCPFGRP